VTDAWEPSDDALTERLGAALLQRTRPAHDGGRKADGPEPESGWDAVSGDQPEAERLALLDRSRDDPDLGIVWRLARALRGELAEPGPQRTGRQRAPRRRALALVAAAVLVAVSAATVFLMRSPGGGEPPVYRQSGDAAIESLLPPGGELSSVAPVLRWSGPEGARYEVSVLREDDLSEVFRAEDLEVAEVELPPAVREVLTPGETLLWRVEAEVAGGRRVASETKLLPWGGSG
jgi:hypothetical protein